MPTSTVLVATAKWLDRLLAEPRAKQRAELLLALLGEVAGEEALLGCSLWAETPVGPDCATFIPVARLGESPLPAPAIVAAVAAGTLPGDLPHGRRISVVGTTPGRYALTVESPSVGLPDDLVELLEVLICSFEALEPH